MIIIEIRYPHHNPSSLGIVTMNYCYCDCASSYFPTENDPNLPIGRGVHNNHPVDSDKNMASDIYIYRKQETD